MYPLETRELAVEAVAAGFSLTEAAELAGCSRTAVVNWAKAAGVAPPPRKKAVHLPFDRKMELVARLEAGERAAELAEWIRWYRAGRLKAFDEGGRKVYDTIAGRRRRLGLAA